MVKNNEVKTTFDSIQSIMDMHPEFSLCGVKDDDIISLLYSLNGNFKIAMDLTVLNTSKKQARVVDQEELAKIYTKIATCRYPGKKTFDVVDYDDVRMTLSAEYYAFVDANFDKQTLEQVNFGDDMYINATLDDSDYDLLIDIEKIGNKFFDSFTSPVQTMFYELPNIGA
ncbi:hypothetical protein KKG31_07740 [Patescibacteria group bacterium]|nr:hypothetical protein [Patescibacteria group bacterium]MBU1758957.1 hypothetical protein [Patescibacteria group bacterium]